MSKHFIFNSILGVSVWLLMYVSAYGQASPFSQTAGSSAASLDVGSQFLFFDENGELVQPATALATLTEGNGAYFYASYSDCLGTDGSAVLFAMPTVGVFSAIFDDSVNSQRLLMFDMNIGQVSEDVSDPSGNPMTVIYESWGTTQQIFTNQNSNLYWPGLWYWYINFTIAEADLPTDIGGALDDIKNGRPRPNVRKPKPFDNDGRDGSAVLPTHNSDGTPIIYTEHTVNPRPPGGTLDGDRICEGDNGRFWVTEDHFITFKLVR